MNAPARVMVYGSMGLRRGISDLLWAFRKSNRMEEFPAYLDDHPFQVIERVKEESKNRMRTADVVIMPHYAVLSMGVDGLLSGYMPAWAESPPLNMRGLGTGAIPIGVTFMAMAYNSKLLKRRRLPSGVDELGGSEWAGKLGTQSLTAGRAGNLGAWYLSFLRGKSKDADWRALIESLSTGNRPRAYDCIDHLLQGLVDGEFQLALTVYSLAYFRERASSSTVELVDDKTIPHMMTFTSAALTKGAEDNGSARKFMDFLLSPEAQKIIGGIPGIAPVRRGIKTSYNFEHSYGETTEFHPQGGDFEKFATDLDLFREEKLP